MIVRNCPINQSREKERGRTKKGNGKEEKKRLRDRKGGEREREPGRMIFPTIHLTDREKQRRIYLLPSWSPSLYF